MNILKVDISYLEQAVSLAEHEYEKDCSYVQELHKENYFSKIKENLEEAFCEGRGYVCVENDKVTGFMIYNSWVNDGITWVMCPVWGYGVTGLNREKVLSRLFETMAAGLCAKNQVHFYITLYAHDSEAIRLFTFMQFGM